MQPEVYVAMTLRAGIKLYQKTGIKPNMDWTPTAMLAKASKITGRPLKRGQYDRAIENLTQWIDAQPRG